MFKPVIIARQLQYFIAVAEEENFHRAAERLNIAQSALSRRIKDLETDLGVRLFDRTGRSIRLNEAGHLLLAHARRITADISRVRADVAKMAEGSIGALALGFNEIAFRHPIVIELMRGFRAANPKIEIDLKHMVSSVQVEMLRNGSLDCGLLYNHYVDDEDLASIHLFEDEMMLAINTGHPLANRPDLTLYDLRHEPFIWASRQLAPISFDRMIAAFQAQGISPLIAMEIPYSHLTMSIVAAGFGLGFVTATEKGREPANVRLMHVEGFDVRSRFDLVWLRSNTSKVLKKLTDHFSSHAPTKASAP